MSGGRLALVAFLVVANALCYVSIKAGLQFAPPLAFAGLRAALGGAVLLGALVATGHSVVPPRRLWLGILGLAALGTTLLYSAMFMSPGRTGAGIASVVGNTGPIWLVGFGALFLEERITRVRIEAMALGFVGVGLIALPALVEPSRSGAPAFLIPLAAALGAAGATVLLKRMEVTDQLLAVAGWQLLIGAVPILALSGLFEPQARIVWSSQFVLLLAFLSLVGTAGALSIWYWLVQREEVGRLGLLLFAVPPLGLLFAWIVFRERVGAVEALGLILTILGILRVALDRSRDSARSGPMRPLTEPQPRTAQ